MDVLQLTRDLVQILSPSGSERDVCEFAARLLESNGWTVTRQPVGERFNVYARHGNPDVVFTTHLDTVPPELPFVEDDECFNGRGTCDAKGIAAAMIVAAERLHRDARCNPALLFVVGEENGSDGAKAAAALQPKGRFLINGEPTDNTLTLAQKGTLRVLLEARGRAAHSGYPELGDSAIDRLLAAIARIRNCVLPHDDLLGETTVNIGRIEGGVAANVVAPHARAELLVRLVGDYLPVRAALMEAAGDVAITCEIGIPPARGRGRPGWPTSIAKFASDLAYHQSWGECYQLGPGSIQLAHTDRERIGKRELYQAVELYCRLAAELVG